MKLLMPTSPAELPEEALLARLRCRRAAIDLAGGTGPPVADAPLWVYRRLNRRLRQRLEPILEQLALRSLILALRYALAGESPPAAVLSSSLLAEPLQRLTRAPGGGEGIVERLETALASDYPFCSGLRATYLNQGPGGVEQRLVTGFLQQGLARTATAGVRSMLRYLVDMRNCLMIHKLWRWQISLTPPLVTGGTIATASLQRIWATQDSARLAGLLTRLTGEPVSSSKTVAVEQSLLRGITRLLRRVGREPLGPGVIIEYLWRAQLSLHNQLLRQTLAAEQGDLLEEVLLL